MQSPATIHESQTPKKVTKDLATIWATIPSGMSKEFFDFVKGIGESRTKQEEDAFMKKEVFQLRHTKNLEQGRKIKELLVRLIYCEMLGHQVDFGYIISVNATQTQASSEPSVNDKRIAYLATSLFIHENHEFMMLLINSMKKDLESDNYVEIAGSLTSIAKLIGKEYVPAVLPNVVNMLDHPKEMIRKKAVIALERCLTRDPDSCEYLSDKFRKALRDKDPSVMFASLSLWHTILLKDAARNKDLVPSFVCILKQVCERRIPKEYEYHDVPSPWLQIKLLQILALLGRDDQKSSEHMYEVVAETMKRADIGLASGYSIIYEAIRTITTIYPNSALLDGAANHISRFIQSSNSNLKYLGLTCLSYIVQISPKYITEHQLIVIDCLEDPDETLRRRALDLLYKMTNTGNVKVVTNKMISFLRNTHDIFLRTELVSRITQLAERYSPDNQWFVETMAVTFFLGGELVRPDVAHNLLRLIAEGTGEDEAIDNELRVYAVTTFLKFLDQSSNVPDLLIKVLSWVLGEYGYLFPDQLDTVIHKLCKMMDRKFDDIETRGWIITSLTKLIARSNSFNPLLKNVLTKYTRSESLDVQQRAYEALAIARKAGNFMEEILPADASCEDIQVDEGLSFLDGYVKTQIKNGASKPYKRPDKRAPVFVQQSDLPKLKYEYNSMKVDVARLKSKADQTDNKVPSLATSPSSSGLTLPTSSSSLGFSLGGSSGAGKWSKAGYGSTPSISSAIPSPRGGSTTPAASSGYTAPTASGYTAPSLSNEPAQPTTPPDSTSPEQVRVVTLRGTPTKPAAPVQQSEKEKLASAIFGGASAKSSGSLPKAGSALATPAAPITVKKISKASTQPKINQPQGDLLGYSTAASPPQQSANLLFSNNPPSYQQQSASQLFGGYQQPQQSQPQQSASSLLLDLGLTVDPTPKKPAAAQAPTVSLLYGSDPSSESVSPFSFTQPQQQSSSSLFGNLSSSAGPSFANVPAGSLIAQQSAYEEVTDVNNVSFSPFIRGEMSAGSRANQTAVGLVSDANLVITHHRIFKPDETAIIVFIQSTQNSVSEVALNFTSPQSLVVDYVADRGVVAQQSSFIVPSLSPKRLAVGVLKVKYNNTSSTASMNISTKLSYRTERGDTKNLSFFFAIDINDFLRPYETDTASFGGKWVAFKVEKKQTIDPSSVTSTDLFMQKMRNDLHLFPVQVIGAECIAAGKLAASSEQLCLVHAKVSPPALVVSIRTQDRTLTDSVARVLTRLV